MARPRNTLHAVFKVGGEKLLDDIVDEVGVCRDTFADIGTHVQEVEEADDSGEVVLWQGGVVEGRLIAGLVFKESGEIL